MKSSFCTSNKRVCCEHKSITVACMKYDNVDPGFVSMLHLQNVLLCCKVMFWTFFLWFYISFMCGYGSIKSNSPYKFPSLFWYVEVYYVFNTFIFNPHLEHSKCIVFTNIMPKVSKCLNLFENISGTN